MGEGYEEAEEGGVDGGMEEGLGSWVGMVSLLLAARVCRWGLEVGVVLLLLEECK